MNWDEFFNRFNELNILVIGDVMLDSYLFGKVDRISPEAPVPVVSVERRDTRLGGAANVALNLKALGAKVSIASVIGEDEHAQQMRKLFADAQIGIDALISSPQRKTTVKHRIIGNNHQMLRVDDESLEELNAAEEELLIAGVQQLISHFDAVIFEDYDKGVLSQRVIESVIGFCQEAGVPSVVDPKKKHFLLYKGVDLFKPNLKEIKEGLNSDLDLRQMPNLEHAVKELNAMLGAKRIMVTLSEAGVLIYKDPEWLHLPAHKRDIADVSGAGDTVVSVAAASLALGASEEHIAFLSNLAGGLVCEEVGVVPLDKTRLLEEAKRLTTN